MSESFMQTPARARSRARTVNGTVVHEQAVYLPALPTYYVLADNVACANDKHHLSILNPVGSGKVLYIRKLFHINQQITAVTGVGLRFDMKRATAVASGTAITPQKADSANDDLSSSMVFMTGATVTEGSLMCPMTTINEEISTGNGSPANFLGSMMGLLPEGIEIQELCLRPGEGFTVKQITASTIGVFSWLAIITVDDV